MRGLFAPTFVAFVLLAKAAAALKEQGPAISCTDEKKKILCLPDEYSKFDLPYRNDFNVIDIGKRDKKLILSFLVRHVIIGIHAFALVKLVFKSFWKVPPLEQGI